MTEIHTVALNLDYGWTNMGSTGTQNTLKLKRERSGEIGQMANLLKPKRMPFKKLHDTQKLSDHFLNEKYKPSNKINIPTDRIGWISDYNVKFIFMIFHKLKSISNVQFQLRTVKSLSKLWQVSFGNFNNFLTHIENKKLCYSCNEYKIVQTKSAINRK